MAIGQASWRLRDDDNILLGRIESQFLRALDIGVKRLRAADRLNAAEPTEKYVELIIQGLRDPSQQPIFIEPLEPEPSIQNLQANQKPRQLIGQPASPGLAEGLARLISGVEDFSKFEHGDILVCESIQPTMTHLVPLASGIVERRGGMLIHGAIIARELGIPCVNGVANAMHVICDGEELTVDGFLGIVTLGTPDFEMEKLAFSR